MVNQLGKFSQNLAQISRPLRELLSAKSTWVWGPSQEESFSSIKAELCQPTVLAFYDPDAEILISADASSYGLSAVLLQKMGHDWKPVSYASRSLLDAETHYAQIEKEALAITWACEKFSDYVLGRRFAIETDHKPLVPLLSTKLFDNLPPRVLRFRLRLMRFDFTIHHVPGKLMYTADTLSRAPTSTPHKSAVYLQEDVERLVAVVCSNLPGSEDLIEKYRVAQSQDSTVMTLVSYCSSGWPDKHRLKAEVKPYWEHRGKLTVNRGLLLFGDRIIIPKQLQAHTLEKIHQGHQGIERCRLRALSAVWWPGLTTDIETMVKQCHTCVKRARRNKEPMIAVDTPEYPWQRVGADLFELNRINYLVVVDYFSCYFEVAKLTSTTSCAVIEAMKNIFSRYGIPETLVSDNGPQFSAIEMKDFSHSFGFQHVTSSPYYPQGNGQAERTVQTAKRLISAGDDLAISLLNYRTTPLPWCGLSPAELLMGRKLRTTLPQHLKVLVPKWDYLQHFKTQSLRYKRKQAENYNQTHAVGQRPDLEIGQQVWISDTRNISTRGEVKAT